MEHTQQKMRYSTVGMLTLALRLVIGWTYFSAFWRRLILENKLIENEAGYIGEKFNHFLPNALGIKPLIEHLVSNPEKLWWAMVVFTVVEGIVGLLLMLGFFTRLMSIGVISLAMGILLGSGWLGTTCLDEWQIGVLGISGGFVLFLSGSGYFSFDHWLYTRKYGFTRKKWFVWLGSGVLNLNRYRKSVVWVSLFILGITLFTNQYFHGGVYGTLHNKSVKPRLEITNAQLGEVLTFEVMRTEGADVYGSFLIGIQVLEGDTVIAEWDQNRLSALEPKAIRNYYVARIKPGAHSLVLPLGARAKITLEIAERLRQTRNPLTIKLIDISGAFWTAELLK